MLTAAELAEKMLEMGLETRLFIYISVGTHYNFDFEATKVSSKPCT